MIKKHFIWIIGILSIVSVIAVNPFGNMDYDGDGFLNHLDNCRNVYNPDQFSSDNDTMGDLCDPCPKWNNDTCTQSYTASANIDELGGTIFSYEDINMTVYPNTVPNDTSFTMEMLNTSDFQIKTIGGANASGFIWKDYLLTSGAVSVFTSPIKITVNWTNEGLVNSCLANCISGCINCNTTCASLPSRCTSAQCGYVPYNTDPNTLIIECRLTAWLDSIQIKPSTTMNAGNVTKNYTTNIMTVNLSAFTPNTFVQYTDPYTDWFNLIHTSCISPVNPFGVCI